MNVNILHKEELKNLNDKSMDELFSLLRKNYSSQYFIAENPYEYLKSNYVTDENKSVKWNKEQVAINNNAWKAYNDQSMKERVNIESMIDDAIVHNLMDDYGFSHDVASKVYNKAYSEWHDDMNSVKYHLEDLAEFVAELLKIAAE
jgi:hypothetical protein